MSANLYVENNRQGLGRIAGIVVTSLISEIAVNGVCAGPCVRWSDQTTGNDDIAGIDTQLFCGIKGKALHLPCRILNAPYNQIVRQREMHHGRNQLRRERFIGVDMEAGLHMEDKPQASRMSWIDADSVERLKADLLDRSRRRE